MNNVGEGNYLDMNSDTSGYLHEMKLQTKENGLEIMKRDIEET